MNKTVTIVIVGAVFLGGLAVGILYSGDTKLERQIACAEFKDEAERRIKDYYAPEEVNNYTPNELFYSGTRDSCIVVWSGTFANNSGVFTQKAIFDAITNEEIFSELFFSNANQSADDRQYQAQIVARYEEVLREVKGER